MDQIVVRMRLEEAEGIHVTVGVFAGPDEDHLGRCGTITFRFEEWEALRKGKGRFQVKMLREMPVVFPWSITNYPIYTLQYDLLEYANLATTKRSL